MRSLGLVTMVVWTLALSIAPFSADTDAEPIEIEVDCDAGERLDDVFGPVDLPRREVELVPDTPVFIHVRGTCVGNLVIERNNVTIRGESRNTTVLGSAVDASGDPVGPTVKVLNADTVKLADVRIEGGFVGLDAVHSQVTIERVLIHANVFGVSGRGSSTVIVEDSTIADNVFGVVAFPGSGVTVVGSEILRSELLAATASGGSLSLFESRIVGGADIFATSAGRLVLSDVEVSQPTPFSFILLGSGSELLQSGELDARGVGIGLFDGSLANVTGTIRQGTGFVDNVIAADDSYVHVSGNLHSDLVLFSFAKASVSGTVDRLMCFPATDAICEGSVFQTDCASCGAARIPDPLEDRPALRETMAEMLRRLEQEGPESLFERYSTIPSSRSVTTPDRRGRAEPDFSRR